MKKTKILGILFGVMLIALGITACQSEPPKEGEGGYLKITAEEAKKRMDSENEVVILDVRTKEEYEEAHIPGAILIPNEEIGKEPLEQLADLDKEILVYCRSGNRSAQAAKKMIEAGYTKVYDFGGITDWPYETEAGAVATDMD